MVERKVDGGIPSISPSVSDIRKEGGWGHTLYISTKVSDGGKDGGRRESLHISLLYQIGKEVLW